MKKNKITEDGRESGFISHKIISSNKLLDTHSESIQELLKDIATTHNITIGDAADAVARVINRIAIKK